MRNLVVAMSLPRGGTVLPRGLSTGRPALVPHSGNAGRGFRLNSNCRLGAAWRWVGRLPDPRQHLRRLAHASHLAVISWTRSGCLPPGRALGAVGFHVVQLPLAGRALGHQLPVARAHGPVAFVLPEERRRARSACLQTPGPGSCLPAGRWLGRPVPSDRLAPARSTQVAMMSIRWPGCVRSSPWRVMPRRPVGDQRRADAALVDPVLVFAERGVARRSPSPGRRRRRCRPGRADTFGPSARGSRRASAAAPWPARQLLRLHRRQRRFGGARLFGVVLVALRPIVSAQPPLSCRNKISVLSSWPVLASARRRSGRCPGPCGRPSPRRPPCTRPPTPCPPLCPSRRPAASTAISGRSGRASGLCEAGLADRLVAAVVFALVFGDVLRQGVHRPVGGGVGDVQEERLARRAVLRARR